MEKRRHARHTATEEALALGLTRAARLIDLSEGGMGIMYFGDDHLGEELTIDLLHTSRHIHLEGIPCRKISDVAMGHKTAFSFFANRRLGLQFVNPYPGMIEILLRFAADGEH